MFSLCHIAAHELPQGQIVPEVVARDILTHTSNKIVEINKKIDKEDKKYLKMFDRYTDIIDLRHNVGDHYARTLNEESLYDIIASRSREFKILYTSLPENYDESSEWFAYLEFMYFRAFPTLDIWLLDDIHINLFFIVKGIIQTIDEVPEPRGPIPQELIAMKNVFSSYVHHMNSLEMFIQKRFSPTKVFELQKKYVKTYEYRSKILKSLKGIKEFYTHTREKMYSSIYIPSILK